MVGRRGLRSASLGGLGRAIPWVSWRAGSVGQLEGPAPASARRDRPERAARRPANQTRVSKRVWVGDMADRDTKARVRGAAKSGWDALRNSALPVRGSGSRRVRPSEQSKMKEGGNRFQWGW